MCDADFVFKNTASSRYRMRKYSKFAIQDAKQVPYFQVLRISITGTSTRSQIAARARGGARERRRAQSDEPARAVMVPHAVYTHRVLFNSTGNQWTPRARGAAKVQNFSCLNTLKL